MPVSRTRQFLTILAVVAFSPGAVCLGPLGGGPGGTWSGTCSLGRTVPFTLTNMQWVLEGEDILLDATGVWALYLGTGEWDGITGDADLAVCVDEAFCRLNGVPFRPDFMVAVIDTNNQPFLQGRWLPEEDRLTGDCYVGQSTGTFTASR